MRILGIIFYIIGFFCLFYRIGLAKAYFINHQIYFALLYVISIICFTTGSILIGIELLLKKLDELISSSHKEQSNKKSDVTGKTNNNLYDNLSSFSKDDENYYGTEGSKYKPWICKNCGTRNPILNETCTKCGMKKEQPTDVKSAGNKENSNIDFFFKR